MDVYLKYYENMYRRDDLFCVCKHKKLDFLRTLGVCSTEKGSWSFQREGTTKGIKKQ